MSKFKEGDRVLIRNDLKVNKEYGVCSFVKGMESFRGKVATVTLKYEDVPYYYLDIDGGAWYWSDDMLIPYKENVSNRLEVNELTPKEKVVHLREFLVDESKLIVDESEEELLGIEDWEFLHSLLDCCIKHKIKTLLF